MLGTVVFGVLAGYALARLHFRGRGTLFAAMLLVQIVPFQLLIIPIYVMIVRNYGLADSYLGMIAPFLINSTAVFIFRQFFLQLPEDLFAAAALDGASELRILWSVALPLVRPALLTAMLLTFIGPWNEFLWPFLVTKDPEPAAARGDAGQLHQQHRRPGRRTRTARSSPGPWCSLPPPSRCSWCSRGTSPTCRPRQWSEGMTMRQHVIETTSARLARPRRWWLGRWPRMASGRRCRLAASAPAASARGRALTNLDHLDFLGDKVAPPRAGRGTRRTGSPRSPRSGCCGPTPTAAATAATSASAAGRTTPRPDTYGQGAFNADDMARAAVVYLRHWQQTGDPTAGRAPTRCCAG